MSETLAKCRVCDRVLSEAEAYDGIHFGCYGREKSASTSSSAPSTGPDWQYDPISPKVAFELKGTLTSFSLSEGDKKFLWSLAAMDSQSGLQQCGKKGSYYHNSDGASRIAEKDRTFMSVFYLMGKKYHLVVEGIGNHAGKNETSRYKVAWSDGTKTDFTLGASIDTAAPKEKKKEGT